MILLIRPDGTVVALYSEEIDLNLLGRFLVRRASFVEAEDEARWWVDLRPVSGPKLGPFDLRTEALAAEQERAKRGRGSLPFPKPAPAPRPESSRPATARDGRTRACSTASRAARR